MITIKKGLLLLELMPIPKKGVTIIDIIFSHSSAQTIRKGFFFKILILYQRALLFMVSLFNVIYLMPDYRAGVTLVKSYLQILWNNLG